MHHKEIHISDQKVSIYHFMVHFRSFYIGPYQARESNIRSIDLVRVSKFIHWWEKTESYSKSIVLSVKAIFTHYLFQQMKQRRHLCKSVAGLTNGVNLASGCLLELVLQPEKQQCFTILPENCKKNRKLS